MPTNTSCDLECILAMGIPHLITFLRPYAVLQSIEGLDVVVDGPGLCYHLHHKCLSRRAAARNPLEAAHSYGELRGVAIEWLNGLRDSGAIVSVHPTSASIHMTDSK